MGLSLQTVFSADAHLEEGHVLCEESTVNTGRSLKFRVGIRMPTVSSKEEQNLKPLQNINQEMRV
jgi:hypothetical protein